MRRKPTFGDRLEALLDEANPEQLRRMVDLASFALRREARKIPVPGTQPVTSPKRRKPFVHPDAARMAGIFRGPEAGSTE